MVKKMLSMAFTKFHTDKEYEETAQKFRLA